MRLRERLDKIEAMLAVLVERQQVREWYSTDEFARLVGKAEFTVREWCRLGRVHAETSHVRPRGVPGLGDQSCGTRTISTQWTSPLPKTCLIALPGVRGEI